MIDKSWNETLIDIVANVNKMHGLTNKANSLLIFNPDATNFLYARADQAASSTRFDITVAPLQWGIISRPFDIKTLNLLSAANNTVPVIEAWVKDPLNLLVGQMAGLVGAVNVLTIPDINLASNTVLDTTLQNAAVAIGNGTNAELAGKYGSLAVQVKGITSATITFEASNDGGTTWVAIRGINQNSGNGATTTTADGIFRFSVSGIKLFRARISTWASGTITVLSTAIAAGEPANQATTTTGTVAIDQATPGTTNAVQVTAGAAIMGKVGIDQTTPGTTNGVSLVGNSVTNAQAVPTVPKYKSDFLANGVSLANAEVWESAYIDYRAYKYVGALIKIDQQHTYSYQNSPDGIASGTIDVVASGLAAKTSYTPATMVYVTTKMFAYMKQRITNTSGGAAATLYLYDMAKA